MREILREIGMIVRALDSISNIEFKEYELTKGQYLYCNEYVKTQELFKKSYLR